MLRSETLELCTFNPGVVRFAIQGSFPKYSSSPAYYRLVDLETDLELYRIDSLIGISPTKEMVPILTAFETFFAGPDAMVKVEISLPDDVSTLGAFVKLTIEQPLFEPSPIFQGMDIRCIETEEPPSLSVERFDIFSRIDQSFAAQVLVSLSSSAADVQSLFDALRPRVEQVQIVPNDLTTDHGWVLVRQADVVLVCKLGTQTGGQLVTQGQQFMQGPVPIAGVGTIPIWASAALDVLQFGIAPQDIFSLRKLILVGYSLGGAAMSALAIYVKQTRPGLPIDVLTYGCPKPGDVALARNLQRCGLVRIENGDDPIPFMPPDARNLNAAAQTFLGDAVLANFTLFKVPRGRIVLFPDGRSVGGGAPAGDTDEVSDLMTAWAGSIGDLPPEAHYITEYLRRLRL